MTRDFARVAILNRGEAAMRFLRALREYNRERGTAIAAVALVTDPDRHAPFALQADEVVPIGPALRPHPERGTVSAYTDVGFVLDVLRRARCDAAWPGWGFAAEDPEMAEALERAGIRFIGPPAAALRRLGDKIASRRLAERAGVPLAPWAELADGADPHALAREIGYPLMVKASAGGGGRGIRRVDGPAALDAAIASARAEAERSFGSGALFLEACVDGARHVEVQLVATADGRAFALGTRDCSAQRRNQKVLEEAPAPGLDPELERALLDSTVRLAEAAGYEGVGTAEFLVDRDGRRAYFLEVNGRLQVEHTVTELVAGTDLVHAQLDIARGLPWRPPERRPAGCAVEVRLNAESPERGFAPAPGRVRLLRLPAGPGVRVDSGIVEGERIPAEFDSMVAKVIAWAPTRSLALHRLARALRELEVVIEDGETNKAFLSALVDHPLVRAGRVTTRWIDRAVAEGELLRDGHALEALVFAAVHERLLRRRAEVQRFFKQVARGIPTEVPAPEPEAVELRLRGRAVELETRELGDGRWEVAVEGAVLPVRVEFTGEHSARVEVAGRRRAVLFCPGRGGLWVEVDGVAHTVETVGGGVVRAPSPALVVGVAVEPGERVEAGQRLVVLEAMKMEVAIFAPETGTVREVPARPQQQVAAGDPLVVLEPEGGEEEAAGARAPLPLPEVPADPLARLVEQGDPAAVEGPGGEALAEALAARLRAALLGWEVPADELDRLVAILHAAADRPSPRPRRWLALAGLLDVYADIEALFDRRLLHEEGATASAHVAFHEFCRRHHEGTEAAPAPIRPLLERALGAYGADAREPGDRMREALWRMAAARGERRHRVAAALLRLLVALARANGHGGVDAPEALRGTLTRLAWLPERAVADLALQARYALFERRRYVEDRREAEARVDALLRAPAGEREAAMERLAADPRSYLPVLFDRADPEGPDAERVCEAMVRRLYLDHACTAWSAERVDGRLVAVADLVWEWGPRRVLAVVGRDPRAVAALAAERLSREPDPERALVELLLAGRPAGDPAEGLEVPAASRLTLGWADDERLHYRTWERGRRRPDLDDTHPEAARRLDLWRLEHFRLERLDAPEQVHAFRAVAREHPEDERVLVYAEVRSVPTRLDAPPADPAWWEFERAWFEGLSAIRAAQAGRPARRRLYRNRLTLRIRPPVRATAEDVARLAGRFEPSTRGLGLEKVVLRVARPDGSGGLVEREFVVHKPGRHRLEVIERDPPTEPLQPMSPYEARVVRARRMGLVYPYEIARMLEGRSPTGRPPHPDMREGRFVELDLDETGTRLVPVRRPPGRNEANVVVGLVTNRTERYPEGIERVWIAGDPTRSMGALAEPECRRIVAAIDLAEERDLPVEWVAVSAGARISMDSGTENLDWTAAVLRRIVRFTEAGGEIHVIVAGTNVGAQSYWNAEATMLMHTRGVLVMTGDGSMVLTGRKALAVSGGVGAEDERGIGGFERVMGPNGEARFFARDLGEAYAVLFDYYRYAYRRPGEPGPRRFPTTDPADRDVCAHPYRGEEPFRTIGEIFSDESNPGRKKPFAIRELMGAVVDADGGWLESWAAMADAEGAVVWDAFIGGHSVRLLGFESRPLPRRGPAPLDGPETWTGGTLFPLGSKKVARAIREASGRRPVVVLANLSGFDGSPESLRRLQLEYGAEIGRSIVDFEGRIVFVVVGRYHGGAYVVFSKALNPGLTALAVEGSYASVIGGAPAAAVVFTREVRRMVETDPRVVAAREALARARAADRARLRDELEHLLREVRLEHERAVAARFDAIHTVGRAVRVGSLDAVIPARALRPAIVAALEGRPAALGVGATAPGG